MLCRGFIDIQVIVTVNIWRVSTQHKKDLTFFIFQYNELCKKSFYDSIPKVFLSNSISAMLISKDGLCVKFIEEINVSLKCKKHGQKIV